MKRAAFLINCSRGGVVDENALVAALRRAQIAGAALDVFDREPLPANSPLRAMQNVYLSPHTAGYTSDAQARMIEILGASLRRVIAGAPPFNVINMRPSAMTSGGTNGNA
jgi:D-3-phosphoglycerate dehydrogenase